MGCGYSNLEVFEDIRKCLVFSREEGEYVSMDRTKICDVTRRTIDNV